MHQIQLAAEMAVIRLCSQRFAQGHGDFTAQFCGGGVGKGDNQKFVDVLPFPADPLHHPIHQHLGLAGTGGGGYQQRTAAIFHHGSLLGCQFSHLAHLLC